jgi:glycosyltransferase involved in cell wall biosynthesis
MGRGLAAQDHQVYLYLPSDPHLTIPSLSWATVRQSNTYNAIERVVWGQTTLPRLCALDGNDILWGPAHRLPHSKISGVRKVLTIHDLVWQKAPETMALKTYLGERLLMTRSVKAADRIIVDSRGTKDDLIEFIPETERKTDIIYPIVRSVEGVTKTFNRRTTKKYLLFVGTLEPRKNLIRLIEAWKRVSDIYNDEYSLIICGKKGWGDDNIENYVTKLGIQQSVILTGFVSEDELSALYAHSHAVMAPSLYEGFGYSVIEAQQYGKRVLTSRATSMAEIGGDTVVLVDPLDVSSIAEGMKRCLTEDNSLFAACATDNAACYRPEVILPQLLAVLEEERQAWKQ